LRDHRTKLGESEHEIEGQQDADENERDFGVKAGMPCLLFGRRSLSCVKVLDLGKRDGLSLVDNRPSFISNPRRLDPAGTEEKQNRGRSLFASRPS
jgi:hypothetical protein